MSEPKPELEATTGVEAGMQGDPLDSLVRRSMRELDGVTPAGYFEALPQRVEASIDAAIEAGFVGMDEDDAQTHERARRTSSQGLDFGPDFGGPPENRELRQTARSRRATDSRAYRRSLLQTQVGAPQPWWQTRGAVLSVAGVAVAGAVAFAVVRWRGHGGSSEQLGASSSRLPPRPAPRAVTAPADAAPAPTEDQVKLRALLSSALPAARACFPTRPLDEVTLAVTVDGGGAVRALSVRGDTGGEVVESCVIAAVRAEVEAGSWASGGARTIALPLFE